MLNRMPGLTEAFLEEHVSHPSCRLPHIWADADHCKTAPSDSDKLTEHCREELWRIGQIVVQHRAAWRIQDSSNRQTSDRTMQHHANGRERTLETRRHQNRPPAGSLFISSPPRCLHERAIRGSCHEVVPVG